MKKRNKVILIVLSSLLGIVIILVVMFFWALSNYYEEMSSFAEDFTVEYRTPEDLSAIAGVKIPRVELLDSCFIDYYLGGEYTIKAVFAIPENDHKALLRKLAKKSAAKKRWIQNEKEFSLFLYPDLNDPDWSDEIDARKVELDGKMVNDWDGTFFGMDIPKDSCRIILRYGWHR